METDRIKLCNGFGGHVVRRDTADAKELLAQFRGLVSGVSPHGSFPGPNPCSVERADLVEMRRLGDIWLCEKTDGVRAMLYCCIFRGLQVCVLITRAWDLIVCGLRMVPTAMFQGTVLDGELVSEGDGWLWLGFDAVVVAGVPVYREPFGARMEAATRALAEYRPCPGDPIALRLKSFYAASNPEDVAAYLRAAGSPAHAVDGTIFTPENAPVVVGRHRGMFKLKTRHTVDFEFSEPDLLSVWCPKARRSVAVAKLSGAGSVPSGAIVECEPGQEQIGSAVVPWTMVCVRKDKTTANDVLTYERTVVNHREALTLDDILQALRGGA
jgi:hypothetical protein